MTWWGMGPTALVYQDNSIINQATRQVLLGIFERMGSVFSEWFTKSVNFQLSF